jgi:hypothetical protein
MVRGGMRLRDYLGVDVEPLFAFSTMGTIVAFGVCCVLAAGFVWGLLALADWISLRG